MVAFFWNWPVRDILFACTRIWTWNPWISSPAPLLIAIVTSDFRWWYCSYLTYKTYSFLPMPGFELQPFCLSSPALLKIAFLCFWFLPLTISGIQLWCRGIDGGIVVIGLVKDFLFPNKRNETVTSGSLVLHSTTVPQWLLVFTSDNFKVFSSVAEGLVLVLLRLDLWEILFFPILWFKMVSTGSLVLDSTTVLHWILGYASNNFRHLTLV